MGHSSWMRAGLTRRAIFGTLATFSVALALPAGAAQAATAAEIDHKAYAKLQDLYGLSGKAREVASRARGVLIFPHIVKAGLIVGGESGDGVLLIGNRPAGHYNISTLSVGLQAGAQSFTYVMFLMNDQAIRRATKGQRWDIGGSPSVVIVDAGVAKSLNTLTLTKEVYAFPFGQKGLMAGLGLEGTVIEHKHLD